MYMINETLVTCSQLYVVIHCTKFPILFPPSLLFLLPSFSGRGLAGVWQRLPAFVISCDTLSVFILGLKLTYLILHTAN